MRSARNNDQCFICRGYGHWYVKILFLRILLTEYRANQCDKGDGMGVRGGRCFKCNERGHIAKKCPNG